MDDATRPDRVYMSRRGLIGWAGASASVGIVLGVATILALHYVLQMGMLTATFVGSGIGVFVSTVVGNGLRAAVWRRRQ